MRDIPVFTTEYGAAGLVLREIPSKSTAYITIHSSLQPDKLLKDCMDFCKMAGAEKIYATGHPFLEGFPLHTIIWKMERPRQGLPETDAVLQPVTESTLSDWRDLYNQRMANVPNSATMTREDAKKHAQRGAAWFVYREDILLGIGIAADSTVESVISVKPGAGQSVLLALCGSLTSQTVQLEVASVNLPAVRLYERLGFQKTQELSRWYDVEKKCY